MGFKALSIQLLIAPWFAQFCNNDENEDSMAAKPLAIDRDCICAG